MKPWPVPDFPVLALQELQTLGQAVFSTEERFDPAALDSATAREFVRAFRLKPGLAKYDVTVDVLPPFAQRGSPGRFTVLDLETRSLLMELTRLDLQAKPGDRPLLTLPLSR